MDTLAILKATPLFAELDAEELDAVAKCVVQLQYEDGETLIQEGTPGEALYLVKEGSLRVEKQAQGKRLLLAEVGPGKAVGEMSLIDDSPTSASVVASEHTEVLALGRLDLNVLLNWNPILAAKMWRSFTEMLSGRLREMNERMLERFGEDALK